MPEQRLTLAALGWNQSREESFRAFREKELEPGRIAVEDKHYYLVLTERGDLTGQIAGRLLHLSRSAAELPKVGDWVACSALPTEGKATIHHVLERKTKLSRKVAGRELEEQVLAANIDLALVVQALDCTFNAGRMQRHLVMVLESGARPVIVLNKADLCQDIPRKLAETVELAGKAPVVVVSGKTGDGIGELGALIKAGETAVFMGSSGVGKSTLINDLCGEEIQATMEVRERDSKGRHTTAWRELIPLPGGGLVIDTPGMREFQMWIANEGMLEAFSDVDDLAIQCHFPNCTHTVEPRCAVIKALQEGSLARERYVQYVKIKKELAYLQRANIKHSWQKKRRG